VQLRVGHGVLVVHDVLVFVGYGVLVIHDVSVFVGCGVVVQLAPTRFDVAPTGVTIGMKSRGATNIEIGNRMLMGWEGNGRRCRIVALSEKVDPSTSVALSRVGPWPGDSSD
jgi:hypothetical protein